MRMMGKEDERSKRERERGEREREWKKSEEVSLSRKSPLEERGSLFDSLAMTSWLALALLSQFSFLSLFSPSFSFFLFLSLLSFSLPS